MNLLDEGNEKHNDDVQQMLHKKMKPVFQEYNKRIFSFSDDEILELINGKFKPRVADIMAYNEGEF